MATIRAKLRESTSGEWFDQAAKRLHDYVTSKGGSIPSKSLVKVHPSFSDLTVGFADATGLLAAAGSYRTKESGDRIVLEGGSVGIPDAPKPQKHKPAPQQRKTGSPKEAPVKIADGTLDDVIKGTLSRLNKSPLPDQQSRSLLRRQRMKHRNWGLNSADGTSAEIASAVGESSKSAGRRGPSRLGTRYMPPEQRQQQFLDQLRDQPRFSPDIAERMETSRQNVHKVAKRLLAQGKIKVVPIKNLKRPICYRLATMPEQEALKKISATRPH